MIVSFLFERIDRLHATRQEPKIQLEGGRELELLLGLQGLRSTIYGLRCTIYDVYEHCLQSAGY